jgi:CRP-like cAMP-binding protein
MQGSIENANFDGIFSQLLDEERAAVLAKAEIRTFAAGDKIIREETQPDAVYIITKGRVRVTKGISGSLSADFAGPLGLGEVIGEMSFIDGSSASATLVADGEVETICLAHADLRDMISGDALFGGRLYHSLLLVLIARLRVVNTRILLPFF